MNEHSKQRLGVYRLIESSEFSMNEKATLLVLFEEVLNSHPEHRWLKRKPGASFNPLPARLIEILLREAKLHDFSLCKDALGFLVAKYPFEEMERHILSYSVLALSLDIARHLHLATMPSGELLTTVSFLKQVAEEHQKDDKDRLTLLFHTALDRFLKNHSPL